MLHPQLILDLNHELVIDNFAGGGGASTAIELALGRHVDHAINHNREALGMHRINHPQTVHHCEDVFEVDPKLISEGRPIGLVHFSPDCRHFSKAKGGKPVEKRIRGLCLVMLRYAKIGARVMTMENVEEITTWGPLKQVTKKGVVGWYPDEDHKGRTWQAFLNCLGGGIDPDHPDLPEILEVLAGTITKEECVRGFGYRYDSRILRACDYGAPTIRKRFFMVARRDGRPIVWPPITHGNPALPGFKGSGLKPWRTIAECIDWSVSCPSIFLTREQARIVRCKRPLAAPTLRRIAKGIERYVLKAKQPFLGSLTHQGGDRVEATDAPINTITGAHRGEKAVVAPSLTKYHGNHQGRADGDTRGQELQDPLLSQDTSNRFSLTEAALAPFMTEHAHASSPRNHSASNPLPTACAGVKGGHFALVSANLMVNTTHHTGSSMDAPTPTLATGGHQAVITGHLVNTTNGKFDDAPSRAIDPSGLLPTVTSSQKFGVVTGTLVGAGGPAYSGKPKPVDVPMNAQTTENHSAIACATLVQTGYGERNGQEPRALDPDKPLGTVVAGGCKAAVITGTLVHTAHGEQDKAGNPRRGRGAHDLHESMPSLCASNDGALAAASMIKLRGTNVGDSVEAPMHTASAGGQHHGLVAASIVRHFGQSVGQSADAPAPTVVAGGQGKTGLVSAVMAQHNGGFNTTPARPVDEPLSSICSTGSQQQVVAASVASYYGSEADGQSVTEPARTTTAKARMGLVESTAAVCLTPEQLEGARTVAAFLRAHGVEFEGDFATVAGHVIVDIGMRMLLPRELYLAQGFPADYIIDKAWHIHPSTGEITEQPLTKEAQIRMCGNSVSPPPYAALVRANVPELILQSRAQESRPQRNRRRKGRLQPS
jgi:DNA (cytosine-5)-methyltransferase 1